MARIVVTGGSGHTGWPVVQHLQAAGHAVTVVDRVPPPGTNGFTIQTQAGTGIVISDTLGVLITLVNGTMIQMTPAGTLSITGTAAVNVVAPMVDVNAGALQVT